MTPVLTQVAVRIPAHEGPAYRAVVIIARDGRLTGLGEAPMVAGRSSVAALAAAESCARLDLEARRRGVRLAELLGGVRRGAVECSALVTDAQARRVVERVGRLAEQGYRCFKLKAANGGGMLDEERLGGARWAGGRDSQLRLDFNGRLELTDALTRLPSLHAFGVELF
jgi:L-alanine-DL-glutamate epimerase-like enolase superfamily enzyme